MNTETLIAELKLKLSPVARSQLDALARSPEAERLFERESEELRAERTEHAQRLAGLGKRYAPEHAAAVKKCAALADAEVEAASALQLAKDALRDARHGAEVLATAETRERWEAERSLRQSADIRLQEFAAWCLNTSGLAHAAYAGRLVIGSRSWLTGDRGSLEWSSNESAVTAAQTGLKSAEQWARAAQLEVLDRQQITDRINEELHLLEPVLEPLRLFNAELTEHGNLEFDRTKKPGEAIRDAVTATGFKPDAEPSDAPPTPTVKTYRGRPSVQHASRQLDQLA